MRGWWQRKRLDRVFACRSWTAVATGVILAVSAALPAAAQERRQPAQGRSGRLHGFVAAGSFHTLFVTRGEVWAWGDNGAGQLGTGAIGPLQSSPVQVSKASGMVGIVAVAAGAAHSMALDSTGHVWTWGENLNGQIGDGSMLTRPLPVRLAGIPGFSGRVTAIAAGHRSTLALTVAGEIWSWGDNSWGQLGDGTTAGRTIPMPAPLLVDVKQISAGAEHGLALDVRGRIWAWGRNNRGQLGDGTTLTRPAPVELFATDPTRHSIEVAAGDMHSLCIDDFGIVRAWGADVNGQLGNGPAVVGDQLLPLQVLQTAGFDRAVRIAAGGNHSLALNARGQVYGWGANFEGQVGDGTPLPGGQQEEPALAVGITGLPGATAIAAGAVHSLALQSEGKVLAWGSNLAGQVGNGSSIPVTKPLELPRLRLGGMLSTAGAWKQTYILKTDGTLLAWGENSEGQLGDGTSSMRLRPGRVEGLASITAISANTSNVLALRSDGTVWAWGKNQHGQVGLPPNTGQQCPPALPGNVCRPVQVAAGLLVDVKAIAAGTYFHLALQADGTVWSWGNNGSGQLGRGLGPPNEFIPDLVPGLDGAIALAGGGNHGLALMSRGTVKSWGRNTDCELGVANCCAHNGPGITRCSNPVAQPAVPVAGDVLGLGGFGLLDRITAINAGLYHLSVALDVTGRVLAWGDNLNGQLGDGNSGGFWVGSYPGFVIHPASPSGLLDDINAVAGGGAHGTALKADGTVHAWGQDNSGQLGDGLPLGIEPTPVTPVCIEGAIGLQSGGGLEHAVIRTDDWAKCPTGLNDFGQLGDGTTINTAEYFCDRSAVGASLLLDFPATGRLFWDPVPWASSYRVYRGLILPGLLFTYNHACLTPAGVPGCPAAAAPCPPAHIDPALPLPGEILYYFVTSRGTCGEDHLGRASDYKLRPKTGACPP